MPTDACALAEAEAVAVVDAVGVGAFAVAGVDVGPLFLGSGFTGGIPPLAAAPTRAPATGP